MTTEGYKGHRPGSRKEKLHKIFDEGGPEKAVKAAEKEGIAASTIRTWMSSWRRSDETPSKAPTKKAAAAPAKKSVKKSAPKKPAKKAAKKAA